MMKPNNATTAYIFSTKKGQTDFWNNGQIQVNFIKLVRSKAIWRKIHLTSLAKSLTDKPVGISLWYGWLEKAGQRQYNSSKWTKKQTRCQAYWHFGLLSKLFCSSSSRRKQPRKERSLRSFSIISTQKSQNRERGVVVLQKRRSCSLQMANVAARVQ